MKYKIELIKEGFFSTKVDPDKIENLLNEYAKNGYMLKQIIQNERQNGRDEFLIVFEKSE